MRLFCTGIELNGTVRRAAGFICSLCAGKFRQTMTFEENQVTTALSYKDCNRFSLRYFVGPLKDRMVEVKMLGDNFFNDDDDLTDEEDFHDVMLLGNVDDP